ncbi:alpha/beta hydrolase [Nocardia asteroides]|uniref:alpha/beta hydrolase n=1 Tax=Nocardia asteroides TaxID=1824 RepID=UPI001E5348DA|nr:alpha/beta hydrolase [Nocardia asteroides]UGT56361.1 alpha/beta hydrolase [Nocardia asteroides]
MPKIVLFRSRREVFVTGRSALAAVFAVVALLAAATPAHADRVAGTIDIPCAADVVHQDAAWYLPVGIPRGLVWLQHGFARSGAHLSDLATDFAERGYLVFVPSLPFLELRGCTLQNLGDNTGFLGHVAELFADPARILATGLADAARHSGRETPDLPGDLVFVGHSAGAEAVAYAADHLRRTAATTWARMRGVVLLDPVPSFLGDNTDRALAGLADTGVPVLTVAAAPSVCNSFGAGTAAVQAHLRGPFVGVRLPHGAHTDAEGASSDLLGTALCGQPDPRDVDALSALAVGWTDDFIAGTTTPAYYPDPRTGTVAAAPSAVPLSGA